MIDISILLQLYFHYSVFKRRYICNITIVCKIKLTSEVKRKRQPLVNEISANILKFNNRELELQKDYLLVEYQKS